MKELLRPWKLATLSLGMAWLFWGAWAGIASDWDYGISLIMGVWAYATAPWVIGVLRQRRYSLWPIAGLTAWFGVDGCYWLYRSVVNPEALFMRPANAFASAFLYLLAGFVWSPRQSFSEVCLSLKQSIDDARHALSKLLHRGL